MTIPTDTTRIPYTGSGSTATYPYTFKVFDEDDLYVIVVETATGDETVLVIETDYTVDGVGIAAGGNVVLVDNGQDWIDGSSYLATGWKIVIRRIIDITQDTSITSQTSYLPELHEKQFDRFTMTDLQQQELLDRCMKLPDGETGTAASTTFPPVADRPNTVLAFDEDGNPTTTSFSTAGAPVDAQYVVLSTNSTLTNERVLTGTANQITVTDGGAGGAVTLSIPSGATLTAPVVTTITDSALTAGRVVIAGTSGILEDDGGLAYDKTADILTVPVVKFTPGAAPSLANGQQWSDSTRIAPSYRTGGVTEYGVRTIYMQTTLVTVANTAVQTVLTTSADFGSTSIAANYLTVGKTLRFTAWGTFNITGTPTLNFTFQTSLGPTCSSTITTVANNTNWYFEALIPIRVGGATGKAYGFSTLRGSVAGGATGGFASYDAAGEASMDLTTAATVQFSATWGTASAQNTLTCRHQMLEVLG